MIKTIKISIIIDLKLCNYIEEKSKQNLCSGSATVRRILKETKFLLENGNPKAKLFFADLCELCYTRSPMGFKKRTTFELDQENGMWLRGFESINTMFNRIILFDYLFHNYIGDSNGKSADPN
jgi:hypothetical protein